MASSSGNKPKNTQPREMVTPRQAQALQKEGYRLIGTHSAVKLCRWTKHQLRGRGGCYKHTFYGITSYQVRCDVVVVVIVLKRTRNRNTLCPGPSRREIHFSVKLFLIYLFLFLSPLRKPVHGSNTQFGLCQ